VDRYSKGSDRKDLIASLAAVIILWKSQEESISTFVLVHGAWHGGWCWRRVSRLLTAKGYEVFAPTLTGVGELSHLLSPTIDLDTHIADVTNLIKWNELEDVVLVGHSYGGMVISGVAEKAETSLASLVMLDAFYPEHGQSLIDLTAPPSRDAIQDAADKGATTVPARSAAFFNVNDKDTTWVDRQCTPQPIRTMMQKLSLSGARERIATRAYIRASSYPSEPFDQARAKARANGWRIYDVPCGHDVMLDAPERLAEILMELG
jgi:pimeloyl-ACP methyl ester carboxylesterase